MKKDLSNSIINNIKILNEAEPVFDKRGFPRRRWNCKCTLCGKHFIVLQQNLLNGNTTSCGCRKSKSLIGQRFGNLVVIDEDYSKIDSRKHRIKRWICKCDCGNYITVVTSKLKNGLTKSCGCINSKGEYEIIKILQELNVNFKTQFTFPDLTGIGGCPLRFDFAIFDNENNLKLLIEYQGIQHYRNYQTSYGKQQRLYTDKDKKEYCKLNDIPLFEIKYDQNIKHELLNILHDNSVLSL